VADDDATQHGAQDLAQSRNRGQCAEPVDPGKRTLSLRHDALRPDSARSVTDAQHRGGQRHGWNRFREHQYECCAGTDDETEDKKEGGMMAFSPAAQSDRKKHRRDREACGGQSDRDTVGAEGQQSVGRNRSRHGDRDLQQKDARNRGEKPRRR
jgi:hypothetical protein